MKAAMARSLLSRAGVCHPRGWIREVPALIARLSPAPTWMPLTTGTGTTLCNQCRRPVTLSSKTANETIKPAAAVSSLLKFWLIATAAMAFIGCTGRGTPKKAPVRMLARPEKTSVLARSIEPPMLRAIINGRRVPRSPKEPDSSAKGASRRVLRLCFATACRRERSSMVAAGAGQRCKRP